MRIYCLFSFWASVVGCLISSIYLTISKYPRVKEITLGGEVSEQIVRVAILFWLAFLLWA